MTVAIERHPMDPRLIADAKGVRARTREMLVERSRTNPRALHDLLNWTLASFAYATGDDPRAERDETWRHLVRAAQTAAAIFALTVPDPGEPTHVLVGGERCTRPATGPTSRAGVLDWFLAHDLAIAVRSKGLLDLLLDVPTESLPRPPHMPEFLFDYVDTLKSYWRVDPTTLKQLQAVVEKAAPTDYSSAGAPATVRLYLPQMKSLYFLATRQETEFQAAMKEAVEKHKTYWTGKEDRTDSKGFIAYPLLAQAATAHGAGMSIDLDTPYLPAAVVEERHSYRP